MKLAFHQPFFMPWPGYFYKAHMADLFVILDRVQFPRGFTWINRNRLKGKDGELWLTVPVCRKGRGLQRIDQVEIYYGRNWARKHLESIRHSYLHAPYFEQHFPFLEKLYEKKPAKLLELDLEIIHYIASAFGLEGKFVLQSELAVEGKAPELLVKLCEKVGADELVMLRHSKPHFDPSYFEQRGIKLTFLPYTSPIYPQLWGDFIEDLSSFDILFNLGPAAFEVVLREQKA